MSPYRADENLEAKIRAPRSKVKQEQLCPVTHLGPRMQIRVHHFCKWQQRISLSSRDTEHKRNSMSRSIVKWVQVYPTAHHCPHTHYARKCCYQSPSAPKIQSREWKFQCQGHSTFKLVFQINPFTAMTHRAVKCFNETFRTRCRTFTYEA